MSELGIYEGCFVRLENGDVIGPMRKFIPSIGPERTLWRCDGEPSKSWWEENGQHLKQNSAKFDIVELVETVDGIPIESGRLGYLHATIPPHVTQAAMDAGIKADPAYEQFVNAILTAGFKAQYEIEFVPMVEQSPIDMDGLVEAITMASAIKRPFKELGETAQNNVRKMAEAAVEFLGRTAKAEKESENRFSNSEKAKGGQSGLPLDGVTIVFSGATNVPHDTLKGIAESLGAKVSGSVHERTTLLVYGHGAASKFDKAIELNIPCMGEKAWMWMAGMIGYGKPAPVSPYGRYSPSTLRTYLANGFDDWANEDTKLPRNEYIARCVEKFIRNYVVPKNESENGITDSEKPEGGMSTIPSVQTIDEAIKAAVREWRDNNPVSVIPPTHYIAKKVHTVIAHATGQDVVPLVAPEGWYLYECKHEHTSHRFAGQTVTPSDHPGGAWSVDFQRLRNGGMLTGGRGKTLVEAWQNAVAAIKLAEEHGLDI